VYDYQKAKKSALPPFMVEKFQQTFEMQEQAKEKYGQKVRALLERVVRLEKESWDREGAVEDFGGAH
jgi:hypothetical protein